MCVFEAVTAAVAIGSAVVGHIAQGQQADAQADFQKAQARENARVIEQTAQNANQDFIERSFQENVRQQQANVQAVNEKEARQLESLRARATAQTSSSAAGLDTSTNSITGLLQDFSRQEAQGNFNIDTQREFDLQQSEVNKQSFRNQAISRVNSIPRFQASPIARPSAFATGLNATSGALGAFNSGISRNQFNSRSSSIPNTRIK